MGLTQKPEHEKDPGQPGKELLTSRALLLLVIAGGIGELYARDPHAAGAIVAAITALAMLVTLTSLTARTVTGRGWLQR